MTSRARDAAAAAAIPEASSAQSLKSLLRATRGKLYVELASLLTAQRPGLPVIIMSGYTEDTLDVPGLKEPIALLQKPFVPRELRRRIREVLDRRAPHWLS